jgi:hypothetical protein
MDVDNDVFEIMSDADIVRMVSTLCTDVADSDEDATYDYLARLPCTALHEPGGARPRTRTGTEFAMSRPDLFGSQQVNTFQDAKRALTQVSSAGKRQTSLVSFFAQ